MKKSPVSESIAMPWRFASAAISRRPSGVMIGFS
jgi:hypothetical protein